MFIVSQDGKHILNIDCIAEITTDTPAPCIVAVTKENKNILLAGYDPKDRHILAKELADCMRSMAEKETMYVFPAYTPSKNK